MMILRSVLIRAVCTLGCVLTPLAANAQSCPGEVDCGDGCCPSNTPVCFSDRGKCCASDFPILCNDLAHCGKTDQQCSCLTQGQAICGSGCMPEGSVCCDDGSYCPSGKTCGCGGCMDPGSVCCGNGKTCPSGKQCACNGCTDPGAVCCPDGTTCPSGQSCNCNGCTDPGAVCCADGTTCPSGSVCQCGGCVPPGSTCCGTSYCGQGDACCDGKCIPAGTVCCGGGNYCPQDTSCVGTSECQYPGGPMCPAGYPINCGNGYCCPQGTTCAGTGQCTTTLATGGNGNVPVAKPPKMKSPPSVQSPPTQGSGSNPGAFKWGCSTAPGLAGLWLASLALLWRRGRRRALLLVLVLVLAPLSTRAEEVCTEGRVKGPDSAGHCCWQGQVWSISRSTCIGIPVQCPSGMREDGDSCVAACPAGQSITADTAGHCCWGNQVWSTTRLACVGDPLCPTGLRADGETCTAAPACPAGQVTTAETQGHCCWPAQLWSAGRSACIGVPQCPTGLRAEAEQCVEPPACTRGQVSTADTAGHCCWPGQVWSTGRNACIGVPQCPSGLRAEAEQCVEPPACTGGQVSTAETAGHCCWPSQVWSSGRAACIGTPQCPSGQRADREQCVAGSTCTGGQVTTADTAGHCCWPGQVWSSSRAACVGAPQCPAGQRAQAEKCVDAPVCTGGQVTSADTAGHCCWPGQVWSSGRNACIGAPQCPAGQRAQAEKCVAALACTAGQVSTADTAGHCCWVGQVWSSKRSACVGVPQCSDDQHVVGEKCVAGCSAGRVTNADTAGHCCWAAQVWSSSRSACIGVPQCPSGQHAEAEKCIAGCPAGQVTNADTAGRCCWPAQVWSGSRNVCIGVPQCPSGSTARGETCFADSVAPAAPAPPPANPAATAPATAEASPAPEVQKPAPPGPPEGDYAWFAEAGVLLDLSSSRLGARFRYDYVFKKDDPSSFTVGGGASVLTPAIIFAHDDVWVLPIELTAAYRIGLLGGRAQVVPRAGLVAALLVSGAGAGFNFKGSVGGEFRYALGGPGAHRGITAGFELLIPFVGGGWVALFPVGFTF